jgi:hypothetical protein
MFTNVISQTLTALQKAAAAQAITDLNLIFTWFLNLTPEDRKKILKMGDKSESFVRGVLQALQLHPTVAGSLDVAEFEKDLTLWDDLREFATLLTPFYEGLQDTIILLGSELMRQANAGYALIKEAAKTNQALSQIAADLGQRYQKAGPIDPSAFTLPPNGQLTLNGLVAGRQFKIVSGGPVTLYKGNVAGGLESKTVGLNTPIKLQSGWNISTAVNMVNTPTIFTVIQV